MFDKKEYSKEYNRKYREKNKEKELERGRIYKLKNREILNEKRKIFYQENNGKEYYHNNKDRIKEYRALNSDRIKEYKKKNRKKINEVFNVYRNSRNLLDPKFKLANLIRSIIASSIKRQGYSKKTKTYKILGCSFEEFKLYIESKFEPWMTWENRGLYNGELNYGWDIDHIVPLSSAKNENELIELNHYMNLQPLCSKTNRDIKKENIL